MTKKIIALLTVIVMLFSITAISLPASAIFENDILYGDIDNNGKVNTTDARLALKSAAGLDVVTDKNAINRADINNDGQVTLFDARQILRGVSGLVTLQPSGAFSGFKGYKDKTIDVSTPKAAIAVFNTVLNKVKTKHPGFTRSEAADVINFDIKEVALVGINFGNSSESIAQMVEDMIVSESEPEEAQVIIKDTNTYNAMSVEGEDYVSKISQNDAFGIEVAYDGAGLMTIKVALPDSEIENLSQTAYGDIFNTDLIVEDADSVFESVFSSNTVEDAKRRNVKNGVATLVFDTATGNVVSYTTTYETDIYLQNSTMGVSEILSAELKGVQYGTRVTVTYDDFQW